MDLQKNEKGITEQEAKKLIENQFEVLINPVVDKRVKQILEDQISESKDEQKKGRTLSSYLELVTFFSSNASSINRSLALAGIAIIWIFKKPSDTMPIVKGLLNIPLLYLAVSLSIDLLQYVFGAIAWLLFYENKYSKFESNNFDPKLAKDIVAPNWISLPIHLLFLAKIVCMAIAYYHIFIFLISRI